eukprot:762947-Hanusia_phi.AAC.2
MKISEVAHVTFKIIRLQSEESILTDQSKDSKHFATKSTVRATLLAHNKTFFQALDIQFSPLLLLSVHDVKVVGGPAFNSHMLERGDTIIEVDEQPVDADNILEALGLLLLPEPLLDLCSVGSDVPGSSVTLTVLKEVCPQGERSH